MYILRNEVNEPALGVLRGAASSATTTRAWARGKHPPIPLSSPPTPPTPLTSQSAQSSWGRSLLRSEMEISKKASHRDSFGDLSLHRRRRGGLWSCRPMRAIGHVRSHGGRPPQHGGMRTDGRCCHGRVGVLLPLEELRGGGWGQKVVPADGDVHSLHGECLKLKRLRVKRSAKWLRRYPCIRRRKLGSETNITSPGAKPRIFEFKAYPADNARQVHSNAVVAALVSFVCTIALPLALAAGDASRVAGVSTASRRGGRGLWRFLHWAQARIGPQWTPKLWSRIAVKLCGAGYVQVGAMCLWLGKEDEAKGMGTVIEGSRVRLCGGTMRLRHCLRGVRVCFSDGGGGGGDDNKMLLLCTINLTRIQIRYKKKDPQLSPSALRSPKKSRHPSPSPTPSEIKPASNTPAQVRSARTQRQGPSEAG
jgi:hypothetical protein